jgi:uncharacterized repeat protein (TIGR02543 family)
VFVKNPDNNLLVPSGRLVIKQDESVSFKNVTVQNGSTVIMSGGSTLTSGGTLTVTGASTVLVQAKNTAPVGGLWVGVGAGISAINVQIDAGSIISADGQGYPGSGCSGPGSGPGGGPLYCNNQGNGGSYGGIGGGPNPAPTYGSILAPTDLGSGGSGAYGGLTGGTGGGAIQLVVLQTLTNNGTVTANGNGAPGNAGGGSGGSVYVVTGTLAGTGAFTANGGATGAPTGGGGGRIAICYSSGGFGGGSVSANGGTGAANGTATYCLPAVVTTNPAGLNFTVDGTSYSSAQTFYWSNSSSHTIATSSPQGAGGTRNVFSSWSDSGAISHSVTATAGGGAATYTANFTTQYLLTTAVAPSGSGTVGALPSSGDGFYDSGTPVQLTPTASPSYTFSNWTGDQTGTANPLNVTMNAPVSVTANFTLQSTDFTLSPNSSPLSLQWGQSGTVLLTVTPQSGFNQTVSFACSGLPSGASCRFSPNTVTPQGSALNTTLIISTSGIAWQHNNRHLPWTAISVVLAICPLGLGWRRRPKLAVLLLLALTITAAAFVVGCGGGFGGQLPTPINANVTVTATSGTLQHQVTVALNVH